jgi:nucleotide-binding universal stress UspA family protein
MFPHFKTILVATDFSQTSEHALEYARALATSCGGKLHLLHVVPDPVIASAWSEAYAYI